MSMSHWSLHPASIAHPNAELELLIEDDTIHAEGVLDETTIDLLLGAAGSLFNRGAHDVTVDLAGTAGNRLHRDPGVAHRPDQGGARDRVTPGRTTALAAAPCGLPRRRVRAAPQQRSQTDRQTTDVKRSAT